MVKEITISNNINYIFFSSFDLNENYSFYLTDEYGYNEKRYDFTIRKLKNGEDDQDIYPDDGGNDEDETDKKKGKNKRKLKGWVIALIVIFSIIAFLFLFLFIYIVIKHNCC